jgi:DNA-binding NarL/FixJ family response regulator
MAERWPRRLPRMRSSSTPAGPWAPPRKERALTTVFLHVERSRLLIAVEARGSLRLRITTALDADGLSVAHNGGAPSAEIRVVAIDLSRAVSARRLRAMHINEDGERIVAVSPGCGAPALRRAVRAGAHSVVLEDQLEDALAPAVRAAAAGLSAVPAALRSGAERLTLSHREREVLRLAVTGHTNAEIARTLFLAESTVKSHLSSAYRKLGASSRNEAATMILDPNEGLGEIVLGHDAYDRIAGKAHAA